MLLSGRLLVQDTEVHSTLKTSDPKRHTVSVHHTDLTGSVVRPPWHPPQPSSIRRWARSPMEDILQHSILQCIVSSRLSTEFDRSRSQGTPTRKVSKRLDRSCAGFGRREVSGNLVVVKGTWSWYASFLLRIFDPRREALEAQ